MKLMRLFLIFVLLLFWVSSMLYAQDKEEDKGKIDEFENEIEKKEDNNQVKHYEDNGEGEHSSFWGSLITEIVIKPVLFGLFIGSSGEDSSFYSVNLWNSYLSDFPYQSPEIGFYSKTSDKKFAINLSGHYFYESSQLQGFNVRGRILPWPFLSLDMEVTDLTEDLKNREDYLQLYHVFINYHRVRAQRWNLWWGLGAEGLKGNKTYWGPAFNIGTTIYPINPISFTVNYNIASINSKGVAELLLHLNWHFSRVMLYVGYQRFSAGSAIINGAIAGVGVHL